MNVLSYAQDLDEICNVRARPTRRRSSSFCMADARKMSCREFHSPPFDFLPFLPQSRPFPRPYRAQSPSRSPRQNNETPPRPSGRSRPEHTPVAAVHLGSVVRSIAANQGHRNEYSFRLRLRPDRPAVRPADRPTDRQTAGHDDEVIN